MSRRRETEYTALFRALPDAVVFADLEGRITQTNAAFSTVFGYADDEVDGQPTSILYFSSDEKDNRASNPFRFRLTSRREATVVEYRTKSGKRFLGETTSSAVTDERGSTVGFVSIVRDISEEVRLREAQLLAEHELQRSEKLLRESGHLARVGGWELDVDTRRMAWSDEVFRMLQLGAQVEPTLDLALSFFDREGRELMKQASQRAIESGVSYDLELPLINAKGEHLWVRAIGKPHVEAGRITRLTGVLQDITRSKQAEQAKREFISVVSHELRTPLTSIRGALGLINGGVGGELSRKGRELVSIAAKNSERLGNLINDILDIEKIEAGKISLNIVAVELEQKVREMVRSHKAFADSYQVKLAVHADAPDALVRADEARLEQILTNLLSNAVKFSPDRGLVAIRSTKSPRKGFWRVSVSDNGPGIPQDFEHRIFEKFAQADSSDSRKVPGTGLGLSITKALTERMGGYIGYRTRAGRGTTFFVDLPGDFSKQPELGGGRNAGLSRVLVCEDDPDIARLLQLSLREDATHVDVVSSAEAALEMLAVHQYDAITVDLQLPGKGGLALVRDISMNPDWADLAIIVVSATAEHGERDSRAISLGVVDWIQKPIDHTRLRKALQTGTKRHHNTRRPTVLHVEDDHDVVEVTRHLIEDVADTVEAASREQACRLIESVDFDLVILDVNLPDGSGLKLLEDLKASSKANVPVVVFSVYPESAELLGHVAVQLVKSRVTNEDLRETVKSLLAGGS
jgi:PAS domain S-box-containing protein